MGPSSFQWCPVTGQGAMGTNWGTGSSVWTWGRTSSLWGWRTTGTVCPGRLWSLPLWRYSRPAWTRSCAAYCRWPCFSRGVGLDDPQRSLPTPTILWFCASLSDDTVTTFGVYFLDSFIHWAWRLGFIAASSSYVCINKYHTPTGADLQSTVVGAEDQHLLCVFPVCFNLH